MKGWDTNKVFACEKSACKMPIAYQHGKRLWRHLGDGDYDHFPRLPGQYMGSRCSCGQGKDIATRYCWTCYKALREGTEQVAFFPKLIRAVQHLEVVPDPGIPLPHPPHPSGDECRNCWKTHHGPTHECEVCEDTWLRVIGLRGGSLDAQTEALEEKGWQ
jgi:hypothetical protein